MRNLFIFSCMLLFITSCTKAEDSKAPNFSLKEISGKTVTLSDYSNKVVILNFWATWCPPCKAEIPDFVKFHKEYREKGVEIIGIAINSKKEDVATMATEYKIEYPLCISDGKIEKLYGGIRAVPTTVIIDRKGNIKYSHPGALSEAALIAAVKPLL